MKASLLKFKHCLGHQELEVQPGKIMIIEGREGTGKTSILETIQRTFTNKSERPVFVHSEGNKAESYILLDDGTEIKKIFNKDGKPTTSDVKLNGMRPAGTETYLKALISENQLNPISMVDMKDKELNEFILSLIPIKVTQDDIVKWLGHKVPVDTNKHGLQVCKELETSLFDTRTEVNREIKLLEGEVAGLEGKIPEDYDAETWRNVQISELYEKVRKANETNIGRAKTTNFLEGLEQRKQSLELKRDSEIELLEEKIRQLQKQIEDTKVRYQDALDEEDRKAESGKKWLEENPEIDIAPLEEEMKEAEHMKTLVGLADDLEEKRSDLESKRKESQSLTDKLDYVRSRPGFLLKNVQMPVEDLTVDGFGNVLIKGRPLKNLSGGERMKLVTKLAMAAAGPLKMILIDGFEKLSPQAQKDFIHEVQGTEFQFIFTRVTDGPLKIINIEDDGTVVNAETGEIIEEAV